MLFHSSRRTERIGRKRLTAEAKKAAPHLGEKEIDAAISSQLAALLRHAVETGDLGPLEVLATKTKIEGASVQRIESLITQQRKDQGQAEAQSAPLKANTGSREADARGCGIHRRKTCTGDPSAGPEAEKAAEELEKQAEAIDSAETSIENNYQEVSQNGTEQTGENAGTENKNLDAEVLERREISASGGSKNSVRDSRPNSEKLDSYLEGLRDDERRHFSHVRAGKSEWLLQEKTGPTKIPRFENSVFRARAAKQLTGKDTIGRVLSPELQKKLAKTVFKDDQGNILSLFHWTDAKFDAFETGDIGFHFGTLESARDRYIDRHEEDTKLLDGIYKEVYLNITHPVELSDDFQMWPPNWVLLQLKEQGKISEQRYNKLKHQHEKDLGFYKADYKTKAGDFIRELLKELGYDGIIYQNRSYCPEGFPS